MIKRVKTNFPGVRYKEHPTRKHGIQKDRYFTIRYKLSGTDKEEGLGWSSQGMTARKASEYLGQIKQNQRAGEGAQTLKEKRELEKTKHKEKQIESERIEKESIAFGAYFTETYFPVAMTNKKPESSRRERDHFRLWIEPVFKNIPLKDIAPFHCEKIKKNMLDAGQAPRSLQYCFATIRQVWNMARRDGIVNSESPTKQVKLPKIDNKRLRFLTYEEADLLLKELAKRSTQLHDTALLSLYCGLRAGEIFNLEWVDVDLERGLLTLRDTKSGKTRAGYMTENVKIMLTERKKAAHGRFVFVNRKGQRVREVSNAFSVVIKDLGFNDGVTDPRYKVVFHTMRHTFASWLVEAGTNLYTVQKLLGHSTLAMTERYSHLGANTLQDAVKKLERHNDVIHMRHMKKV